MAGTKISALPAVSPYSLAAADQFAVVQSGVTKSIFADRVRQYIGAGLSDSSTATVSAGYAADTYLAGSAVTVSSAGAWRAGTIYICQFDMTKTAAGTAAFTIIIRLGTLGTTGDSNFWQATFGAGTAAADTGIFTVQVSFRTVGGGTSAVLAGWSACSHHLAATGLISTGASGTGIIPNVGPGFNSTTQTIIGVSVNGGASFSGTNTLVQAYALNI